MAKAYVGPRAPKSQGKDGRQTVSLKVPVELLQKLDGWWWQEGEYPRRQDAILALIRKQVKELEGKNYQFPDPAEWQPAKK